MTYNEATAILDKLEDLIQAITSARREPMMVLTDVTRYPHGSWKREGAYMVFFQDVGHVTLRLPTGFNYDLSDKDGVLMFSDGRFNGRLRVKGWTKYADGKD